MEAMRKPICNLSLFNVLILTSWLTLWLALTGCQPRSVESSEARNQRELKAIANSPVGRQLLNHRWCAFVDDQAKFKFRGFLRLTFHPGDAMTVEQYAEDNGRPFGKQDDDKQGLWKLDRNTLALRLSRDSKTDFQVSFSEKEGIEVMNVTNLETQKMDVMWVCDQSVEDPIPVTIEQPDQPTPVPLPDPGDENGDGGSSNDPFFPQPGDDN